MDINERVPTYRIQEPGTLDFAWLEHHIAIGQDHRRPPLLHVLYDVERVRKQAIGEGVIEQKPGHGEQVRIAWILHAIALQSAKIIGITELLAELFEQVPVA